MDASCLMPAGLTCPHCGADVAEVTYVEAGNIDRVEGRWVTTTEPNSMSVYYLYECGGETGYTFSPGREVERDDDQEARCPQREVR